VNSVSACGKFFAEFGTNDAAAAVRRVNGDADVHCTFKVAKKVEAGDPRYRLPLSQLDSPSERGGKRGREYIPAFDF
jgi:hypothetical protein